MGVSAAGPAPRAPSHGRVHGLDTLRAAAIALVFVYHYAVFISPTPSFGWVSEVGWIGVDLFFVLSGYLIADQLLAGLVRGRTLSLPAFFGRRLLRTLPNFYVVLAAFWLFPDQLGGKPPPPLWRFLTFTQNIGLQPGTAFSHAWSLCIEEQFYLLLPLVMVAAVAIARRWSVRPWAAWAVMAVLLLGGVATRAWLWSVHGHAEGTGFYTWVYFGTPTRMDEFLPGVALAVVRHLHPAVWQRWTAHGQRTLFAGLAAVAVMCWGVLTATYTDGVGYGFVMAVFGYSLIAASFALLVLAALSPASWLHRVRVPGAASLAVWSYAIYLTHKPVAVVVQRQWRQAGGSDVWTLPLAVLASLAVGWTLWRLVETPCMRLRARWLPSNFASASADGPRPATSLTA